jgi:hypothetical protein
LRQRDAKAQRNRGGREQREQGKAEKAGEIHPVFSIDYSAAAPGLACPGFMPAKRVTSRSHANTQAPLSSHARCIMGLPAAAKGADTDLPHWPIRHHWPYKTVTTREIP